MSIPKNLKIGGHQIKVLIKPMWKGGDNEIWIKAELSDTQMESTLVHEILHGINSTLDHVVLDSLSEQLYQVLKDNKLKF